MQIVIMAGGKGTRISSINSEVPKPMIKILDKPILEHQIITLKKQGFKNFILIVGHLHEVITEYFGDGKRFGVDINYIYEQEPLGTAGGLFYLKNVIKEEFLLLNGDIIFDVDINRFWQYYKSKECDATILTHPNNHPYDSGVIKSDNEGKVLAWSHKEDERLWYKNRVNAGLHILSVQVLEQFKELKKLDLDRDILKPMIEHGSLYCYDSPEYVKDMGTPERYEEVISDLNSGKVETKNLMKKQKAIFLDRDGTINKYVGFLKNIEEFELIEDVAKAIKIINQSGYLAIVVTNQPVIARGDISVDELCEIHNKMETLLGKEGAYLDAIFYCPHHPDKGFEGEILEYKIDCNCRKPKPGMLLDAAELFNIDLTKSWMVGDSSNDILAGKQAKCNVGKVNSKYKLIDFVREEIESSYE